MDYEVIRGGHGEVRIFSNRAVKVIENTYDGNSLKEIVLLKRLDHPRIVKCKNHTWTSRTLEIDMDLFDCDLEEYSKTFHPKEKIVMLDDMFQPLLGAMVYLKRMNVVHMDIKPSNIFVRDNSVYLGDFSSACLKDSEPVFMATTKEYIPPEGSRVDFSTDVYCLGISILEFLIGEFPKVYKDGRLDICGFDKVMRKYTSSKLIKMLLPMTCEDPLQRPTIEIVLSKLNGSKKSKPAKKHKSIEQDVDTTDSLKFISELETVFTYRKELDHRRQYIIDKLAQSSNIVKEYVRVELVMPVCLFLVQTLLDVPCFNLDIVLRYLKVPISEVYRACEFIFRNTTICNDITW